MLGRNWGDLGRARGRVLERGDLKYVILELLRETPPRLRHHPRPGRALPRHTAPSPSAVTRRSRCLMRWTTPPRASKMASGSSPSPRPGGASSRTTARWSVKHPGPPGRVVAVREVRDELKELMRELGELGRLFAQPWRGPVPRPDQLRRIRAAIARARGEIEAVLTEEPDRPATDGAAAARPAHLAGRWKFGLDWNGRGRRAHAPSPGPGATILLVEDDAPLAEMLSQRLRARGYDVRQCEDRGRGRGGRERGPSGAPLHPRPDAAGPARPGGVREPAAAVRRAHHICIATSRRMTPCWHSGSARTTS